MRKRTGAWLMLALGIGVTSLTVTGCGAEQTEEVVLRVSNWEEYIDEGDWDPEEETIDLADGTNILGENSMIADFEEWYYKQYGTKVRVEYSTFGTNEELYNQMTMGDTYDVVCPSEYMIMKLMQEGKVEPFSDAFYDAQNQENYYINGVSPYIQNVYENLKIDGKALSEYAAGYMWGTLGIVYNPARVSPEDAAHWSILQNPNYARQVTIKDSVRDAYFAGMGIYKEKEISRDSFLAQPDYHDQLTAALNDTKEGTVDAVGKILNGIKDNVYSFETDSGKADMVTGKVLANEQWSGDAVYTLDQAQEDGVELAYAVPEEGTNLWFDGWCMLKAGIGEDQEKKQAAEAFVNFLSRPDNAIRNMYYIGYTSVIAGGSSNLIYDYADWCYGAEDEEDTVSYPLGYFFGDGSKDSDERYTITTSKDQLTRQLFSQYPPEDVIRRSVVMRCFDTKQNERINQMWTDVRCFDLGKLFR